MSPSEERKVVRDGLVRFSDRISDRLLGGEVSVDESASTSQEAEAAE